MNLTLNQMTVRDIKTLLNSISPHISLYPQSNESVVSIRQPEFPYVTTSDRLKTALVCMNSHNIHAMPIVDDDGNYWGVVTRALCIKEKITAYKNGKDQIFVRSILHKILLVPTLSPKVKLKVAVAIFEASKTNYIVLLDDYCKYRGVITRSDVVDFLFFKPNMELAKRQT